MDTGIESKTQLEQLVVAGGTKQGAKKWNEDSFMCWNSPSNRVVVGGVWDGHGGYNGLLASSTSRDQTKLFLDSNAQICEGWTSEEWKTQLTTLFQTCHQKIAEKFVSVAAESGETKASMQRRVVDGIVRTFNGDPVHGGTTATVSVLVRGDNGSVLITANVGDSTGLLITQGDPVCFTTMDHGPENPTEFKRVHSMDPDKHPHKLLFVYDKTNVFRKYECPLIFDDNGEKEKKFVTNPWGNGLHPTNVRYEPAVYAVTPRTISKDSTCIAMTRALGDFYAHPFGLSFEPDISVLNLAPEKDHIIVLGSDGIWDCWKYEDFHQYCLVALYNKNKSIEELGEEALNESIRRAYTNFGAKHYDDAALVVFRLRANVNNNISQQSS